MSEYANRRERPLILIQNQDNVLTLKLVDLSNGSTVSLSVVTVVVTDGSGATISSGSATISSNVASYTVSAASTTSLQRGTNYMVTWTVTGITQTIRERATLARSDFYCPVTKEDILAEEPILNHISHLAGNSTQIDWATFIGASYKIMYGRLASVEKWPHLIISADAFREYLIYDTLSRIFRSLGKGANNNYQEQSIEYKKMADRAWDAIHMDIDIGDDGIISDGDEGRSGTPVVYLGGTSGNAWPWFYGGYYGRS